MPSGVYKRTNKTNKFRRSIEKLREFIKENDVKLLELLKYIRKRNTKRFKKGITPNAKNNS